MSKECILKQLITEKGTNIAVLRQYLFKVQRKANKPTIKNAIEAQYKVKVADINTLNMPGKTRYFGGKKGQRSDWKKAYVTLKEGYSINLSEPETVKE